MKAKILAGVAIVLFGCRPRDLFESPPASTSAPQLARISKERGVQDAKAIRVDASTLQRSEIRLELDGTSVDARRVRIDQRAPGDFTWTGKLDGGGSAILVVKSGTVTGTITRGVDVYQVRSIGGGLHAVTKLDPGALQTEDAPSARTGRLRSFLPPPGPLLGATRGPTTVRVIVGYTPAVTAVWPDIDGMIQLAIDETNAANDNSEVRIRYELAHSWDTGYVESGVTETDLDGFAAKNDGIIDDVHALRDQHAADLAVLLVDNGDFCGMARDIRVGEDEAFAVVAENCATGYFTFGHEIGHLIGCRHDLDQDSSTTPYPYGHGFKHSSSGPADPAWRTIMSYDCSPSCTRIQHWSNPNVTYNGSATGTKADEDNARVLNLNACRVAGFRGPKPCGDPCGALFREFNRSLGAMFHFCMATPVDPACFIDGCPMETFGTTGPVRETLDALDPVIESGHIGLDSRIGAVGATEANAWLRSSPSLRGLGGTSPLPRGGGVTRGGFCEGMGSQVIATGKALKQCYAKAPP